MSRKLVPTDSCQRRYLPTKLKAEIMLRQDGRCADCDTRLILGFFVFDHGPPLALRDSTADANDPDRLAAICWSCNELKTPKDLKEIAKSKRIAEKHQAFLAQQAEKQPGRRLPTPAQERPLQRILPVPRQTKPLPPWLERAPEPALQTPPVLTARYVSPPTLRKPSRIQPPALPRAQPSTPKIGRPSGLPPLLPKPKS
jgi:hypothetical protein